MKIVFSGVIGRLPVGGHAWIAMQYLVGLRELGHDVMFLEDAGDESWVYNWDTEQLTTALDYPSAYVRDCLEPFGFEGRWIYRAGAASAGMSVEQCRRFCRDADLLLIWAVPFTVWREEYDWPAKRAYIDADPGFTQIRLLTGDAPLTETVDRCERLFTIAQRFAQPDCTVPHDGRSWARTVSPVVLSQWPATPPAAAGAFTSIMQWRGFRDVAYNGTTYGQKDREFPKFLELPRLTRQTLRVAVTGVAPDDLTHHGWEVLPGWVASRTPASYQAFIQQSKAEFGIAKHGYVAMRAGWFSDRSACYLASARPVLLQDTGLDSWLPVGRGVHTFSTVAEAVEGLDRIAAHYARESRAAREIAEEHFATDRVLPALLNHVVD
jgi:hypothetical protein